MNRKIITMLILSAFCFAGLVWAQDDRGNPNDPARNERANACFRGGTWAGMCDKIDVEPDGDIDQQDIDWMWRCGWYAIRVERGLIRDGDYPAECYKRPPLPPAPSSSRPAAVVGPVGPGCPPLMTFSVPDVGTPFDTTVVPSLGPVINDIIAFSQSRGLGWIPSTGATGLIALANTYYASPVTLISPDPRTSSFAPRAPGITYTITADIGFDGCYDITVIVTSDTINFVETNAGSFFP